MPNIEYDTRTPEEKKKLMKGKLSFDPKMIREADELQQVDLADSDDRKGLHRHTA